MDLGKFLATRPYSWINTILIGLGAYILASGKLLLDLNFALIGLISFLMWIAGMTFSEFMRKKYEYDEEVSKLYLLGPLALVSFISISIEPLSVYALLLFIVGLILYSYKVKSILGRFSFLFRGLSELSLVLLVFIVEKATVTPETMTYALSIFLVTDSRNLVGDLRDIPVDKYTLPVIYPRLSQILTVFLIIPLIVLVNPLTLFPLLVMAVLISLYGDSHAYTLHRIYVLSTLFFVFNYILQVITPEIQWISNIVFIGVVLNFTYDKIPRKIEKMESKEKK